MVEIEITSPSLDKLPIYAALMVPEVWRYDGQKLTILLLKAGGYTESENSEAVTGLAAQVLSELVEASKVKRRSEWVHFVEEAVTRDRLK
jgi:hypothetical protein